MKTNEEKTTVVVQGFLVLKVLGVSFVILKLTGYIDWSWWIVLLPLYPTFLLWIITFLLLMLSCGCFAMAGIYRAYIYFKYGE